MKEMAVGSRLALQPPLEATRIGWLQSSEGMTLHCKVGMTSLIILDLYDLFSPDASNHFSLYTQTEF